MDVNCILLFQSNLGRFYQALGLEDSSLWSNFSRSSQCEQELPSAVEKRITMFQQVLLVQATRPDRLQSAMSQFACRALGKNLFLNLSLKSFDVDTPLCIDLGYCFLNSTQSALDIFNTDISKYMYL